MKAERLCTLLRAICGLFALILALTFLPVTSASAQVDATGQSEVGIQVDPAPTTQAPPTSDLKPPVSAVTPIPTTLPVPTGTTPPATSPEGSVSNPVVSVPPTQNWTQQIPPVTEAPKEDHSVIATVTRAVTGGISATVKSTGKIVGKVIGGTPVADAAQEVLPAPVANVVVPAVRTASTFVFPIGLIVAVVAFLILQERIDHGDPKLSAAPIAHDDDMVSFL